MTSITDQSVTWKEILTRTHLPKIALLSMALWLHAVNSMLTATTLPSAVEDIGGLTLISWGFTLYLMGSIVAAASVSLVVSTFGLRKSFLAAALIYAIGSGICAVAPNMPILLIGRLAQGVGGGSLMALVFLSQDRFFPNRFVPKLVACFSVVWTVSAFSGPFIGGAFATYGLWRLAFWAFFVQAVALAVAIHLMLKNRPTPLDIEPQPIPIVRLSFLATAILLISFAGSHFQILRSSLLIILGFVFIGFFLVRDKKAKANRMLPLDTTNLAHRIGSGIAMTFVLSMSIMTFLVYGPLILINLYGLTPLLAGFVIVTEAVGWGLAAVIFSGTHKSKEPVLIRIGSLLVLSGIIAFSIFMPRGPIWAIILIAIIGNAGFGMMWGFIIRRIIDAASPSEKDRTGSLIPSVQQLGFAIGAALSGLIANGLNISEVLDQPALSNVTFWVFAGFIPLAFLGNVLAWHFTKSDDV